MSSPALPLAPSLSPTSGARLAPATAGLLLGLGAALIWGTYLAMARAGVSAGLQATDVAFLRYTVAGLVLMPWFLRHQPTKLAGVGWRRAPLLVVLVGPPFILIGVGGYGFAPLAHGAVVQPAALTIGSLVLAALVLKDRPTLERVVGMGVILAGLAVIAGPGLLAGDALTPLGDLMFAAGGLMWAVFTVVQKRWALAPLQVTAVVSVLSACLYAPLYLGFAGLDRILALPLATLLGQVVVQGLLSGVVAVVAFSRATQILGASRAAVFPALVPAVAILVGIPITGELPTGIQLAGLALVSAGLVFAAGIIPFQRRTS